MDANVLRPRNFEGGAEVASAIATAIFYKIYIKMNGPENAHL